MKVTSEQIETELQLGFEAFEFLMSPRVFCSSKCGNEVPQLPKQASEAMRVLIR